MYKVFLVDDEIAIREGIRNSVLWEEGDFSLVGEAPDGEIALPMLQDERPDILLTDIRMPFMDGMQLCKEVKRLMPWMKIIILSGYDDFNYARQAMSLGVQEYLLKPVTAKDLGEALLHAKQAIDQERLNRLSYEQLHQRFLNNNRFVREKLLSAILFEPPEDGQKLLEQLRGLGINLVAKCYAVIDISYTPPEAERENCQNALYTLTESHGGTVQLCHGKHSSFALVLGDNEGDAEERSYAFARSAVSELAQFRCTAILAAIGETVYHFAQISQAAQTARHIRHVVRAGGAEAANLQIVGAKELSDVFTPAVEMDVRPLFERMQYAAHDEVETILREYANSLGAADIHSAVAADYFHVEVLMTATRMVREAGGDPSVELQLG
ncbi:MAG: response regulator [Eubacteriales bacterium]|nr:response regulator [Eubacteriales bacterium]